MVSTGKTRPPASSEEALHGMDELISLSLVGQHHIARRLGLNVTDLTCFGHILAAAESDPISAGELARRTHLTTGAVTGVLNRLEAAEYAYRQPDPADRRRIRIVPDASADARVRAVYEPHYERLSALFADYSPDEIGVLADWFSRAVTLMRVSLEEIRDNGRRVPGGS